MVFEQSFKYSKNEKINIIKVILRLKYLKHGLIWFVRVPDESEWNQRVERISAASGVHDQWRQRAGDHH